MAATEHEVEVEPTTSASGSSRPQGDVVVLAVAMFLAAAAVFIATPNRTDPTRDADWRLLLVLVIAFAASEVTVFHFEFRREAIAFSLSEVPMAVALVYLAPGPTFAVRLVGGIVVLLALRGPPLYKVVFNIGIYAIEVFLAFLIFRSLVPIWGPQDEILVFAAIVAVAVPSFLGSLFVSVAISRFEGGMRERIRSDVGVAWWLFLVNGSISGLTLGLVLVSPLLVVFALVPVGFLWYLMQAYGLTDQRLRDLDALHGFTASIGHSLDPHEIGEAAVAEVSSVMRAEHVAVVIFGIEGPFDTPGFRNLGLRLPTDPADPAWSRFAASGGAQLLDRASVTDSMLTKRPLFSDLLVVPVDDGSGSIGLLVVTGRAGVARKFAAPDLARAKNLSEQLALSLRRATLHQRIEREARHDSLTGLPNRASFERSVEAAAANRPESGMLFVLMLDLDRFKEVNDTLGHHAGDGLLIEVARRMRDQLEPTDVLARLAGDEFAVLCHRANQEEMIEVAWRCSTDLGRPVTLDGLDVVVTASAGLAALDLENADAGAALRHADIAMYNAKTQRLGVEVYRDEIDRRTPARLSLLGDLRAAIDGDGLHAHYQPKLDLTTGTVIGVEALARWNHPVRGMVPPTQFVRVAEETGLIKQLTDMMLGTGIAAMRAIHDGGHHLGLAVNLSTHDLLDTRLATRVDDHLRKNGVPASMLTLEITESSLLIDAPRARRTINDLNDVGVRLSIDDFGTGYSSLSYLRRLPVGELKIDRSFVANVLLDEQDEVIVRSTIDLGHNLGLVVVAEGVENNEVLERLRQFGCDVAQGFCISRPLAAEHFTSWLAATCHPARTLDPLDPIIWAENPLGPVGKPLTEPVVD